MADRHAHHAHHAHHHHPATPAIPLPAAQEGVIWTCPMHPEIRRDAPIVAGAAMAFSSVAVIGNSLRLRAVRQ